MTLYHYTCDHSHRDIDGFLKPNPLTKVVWLTDLGVPMRDALGLTSYVIDCDRTRYRYRVTDEGRCIRWIDYRKAFPYGDALEAEPGVKPMHWWVSLAPVPVVFDPIGVRI